MIYALRATTQSTVTNQYLLASPNALDINNSHFGNSSSARNSTVTSTNQPHSMASRILNFGALPKQVPMEIDLNEFMLDTDLDFLNRHFDINAYPHYHD